MSKEIPVLKGAKADFITIQIGVNDYFQGKDRGTFEQDFITVIEQVQMTAPSAKLLIVTIPDYGKTPAGSGTGNPDVIAAGVAEFNAVITKLAAEYTLETADVYEISQVSTAEQKVAPDGLHPSGEQYTDWLDAIYPAAMRVL